ncbi:MAG TPA: TonB-dependent receptor plug domain-containing protein [Vicinamibacterales bacterium]|nr:TonB-dependent receptor plug domain-containing protein [Vicinamibacterales bacterium]
MSRSAFSILLCALLFATSIGNALAADAGSLGGTVVDSLGAAISGAQVVLLGDAGRDTTAATDSRGEYVFAALPGGRYQIEVRAQGFATRRSDPVFVGASGRTLLNVTLQIGPLAQEVTVTAAPTEVPVSQIGAQVTVIDNRTIDALGTTDVLESLRLVPGAQIVQVGAKGGTASLFVRGGNSNFTKVLVDGVPANDIGGGFDFAAVSTTGVDEIEVLRESNSMLYGSDALAGVVNVTTRRGRTRTPQFDYSLDGGNLGTVHTSAAFGGVAQRLDYFSEYSYFKTDNDTPNNRYRNGTYAGRFSVALGGNTDLSGTIRRADTDYGSPNAFDLFKIADDSTQKGDFTHVGVTAQTQINRRWQSSVRFASMTQNTHSDNPAPTGTPYDPFGFGANYLGQPVTVTGANGYSVTGRAILDFGGTYPSLFDSHTTRNLITGSTSVQVIPGFDVSGGAHYEHEAGYTQSGGAAAPKSETTRDNGGAFAEGRVTYQRLFVSGGVGVEHNAVFGGAATPRVSVAVYARQPSATSSAGDTKITFNAGTGIKAPAIYQELSSLFALAKNLPGVGPIGPERARTLDVGIEQGLLRGHIRARATYFDNSYSNLIEFVSKNTLPLLGVSTAAANASGFGAYVNSQSYDARGLELSLDSMLGANVRVYGSYTYLDAKVTASLSGGALTPATNPAFPGIQIGAFSPLIGNRPFRRPANSGSLLISYSPGKAQIALAGYFSGKQDDSTFLSDQNFGNSMLLPNQNLDAAYAKLDLSGSYRIHPRLKWYLSLENLANSKYEAAFGYPALPATVRTGVTLMLGGDR